MKTPSTVLRTSKIYTSKLIPTTVAGLCLSPPCITFLSFLSPGHRFTVPVLWDKKLHTIVNNESSEIIRIFNTAFNEFIPKEKAALNYYPEEHRTEIDALNDLIYPNINSEYKLYCKLAF